MNEWITHWCCNNSVSWAGLIKYLSSSLSSTKINQYAGIVRLARWWGIVRCLSVATCAGSCVCGGEWRRRRSRRPSAAAAATQRSWTSSPAETGTRADPPANTHTFSPSLIDNWGWDECNLQRRPQWGSTLGDSGLAGDAADQIWLLQSNAPLHCVSQRLINK